MMFSDLSLIRSLLWNPGLASFSLQPTELPERHSLKPKGCQCERIWKKNHTLTLIKDSVPQAKSSYFSGCMSSKKCNKKCLHLIEQPIKPISSLPLHLYSKDTCVHCSNFSMTNFTLFTSNFSLVPPPPIAPEPEAPLEIEPFSSFQRPSSFFNFMCKFNLPTCQLDPVPIACTSVVTENEKWRHFPCLGKR